MNKKEQQLLFFVVTVNDSIFVTIKLMHASRAVAVVCCIAILAEIAVAVFTAEQRSSIILLITGGTGRLCHDHMPPFS